MYQVTKKIKFTRVQLLDCANRQREHSQWKFTTTNDKLNSFFGQELYT